MPSLLCMLDLYLFRHAESKMNSEGHRIGGRSNETPLSPNGKIQAQLLGKRLQKEGIIFSQIFCSPARRTQETAEIVCSIIGFPIQKIISSDAIQELSQGDWEGKSRNEIYSPEILQQINSNNWEFRPPKGESQRDTEERMYKFIEQFLSGETVIGIFGHGMALKCFLRKIIESHPKHTYKMLLENASITRLKHNHLGWHLLCLNDIGHLVGIEKKGSQYC